MNYLEQGRITPSLPLRLEGNPRVIKAGFESWRDKIFGEPLMLDESEFAQVISDWLQARFQNSTKISCPSDADELTVYVPFLDGSVNFPVLFVVPYGDRYHTAVVDYRIQISNNNLVAKEIAKIQRLLRQFYPGYRVRSGVGVRSDTFDRVPILPPAMTLGWTAVTCIADALVNGSKNELWVDPDEPIRMFTGSAVDRFPNIVIATDPKSSGLFVYDGDQFRDQTALPHLRNHNEWD